ncbi:gtp-binding protein [Apiospora marii]|uniref:gtp-binding protein n=1 Tax=Apiospora marii TaxID=335849 RepID=UPI0031303194
MTAPRWSGPPPAVTTPRCSSTPTRASCPDSRHRLRAFARGFKISPVIHEIDLGAADVLRVLNRLEAISELDSATAIGVGPKTGLNVQSLVPLFGNVPALEGDHMNPLRMLLADSWYDEFCGVICLVRVFGGAVRAVDPAAGQVGYIFHRA